MVNAPLKAGLKRQWNEYAANIIQEQVDSESNIIGLTSEHLSLKTLKPLLLQWFYNSWKIIKENPELVQYGWEKAVFAHFDVFDTIQQSVAVREALEKKFELDLVPKKSEKKKAIEIYNDEDTDDERDELDTMKDRKFGTRKSARKKTQTKSKGYMLDTSQMMTDSDSD